METGLFMVRSGLYLAASNPYLPHMKHVLAVLVAAVTFQLGAAPLAHAQTSTPTAAYTGPRYPGGPDSLRALVYRSTHLATPAPAGRLLVQFELKDGQQPHNFKLLPAPGPMNLELVTAAATSLNYLEEQMATWQAGTPDLETEANASRDTQFMLVLDFEANQTDQPYVYVDQNPVFGQPLTQAKNRSSATFDSSPRSMVRRIQTQLRYPREALMRQQEGVVYAYFEVAENGVIEHPRILGTAGQALDAEVLRLVRKLPAATTPPQLQGRPVRVYYTLPCTFKIQ